MNSLLSYEQRKKSPLKTYTDPYAQCMDELAAFRKQLKSENTNSIYITNIQHPMRRGESEFCLVISRNDIHYVEKSTVRKVEYQFDFDTFKYTTNKRPDTKENIRYLLEALRKSISKLNQGLAAAYES